MNYICFYFNYSFSNEHGNISFTDSVLFFVPLTWKQKEKNWLLLDFTDITKILNL